MDLPDLSILKPPKISKTLITSLPSLLAASLSLRAVLLLYGLYQDAHSSLKYTDIDYFVFTDAARYVSLGHSPYARATYRYTPLLAWLLLPTTWEGGWWWFSSGKALFAAADIVAGWLMIQVMKRRGLEEQRALKYVACTWLLNPMAANISTRGSSEGLLCMMVMSLLWALESGYVGLAGVLLGLSVHFKIYPFIYGASMLWALESHQPPQDPAESKTLYQQATAFLNPSRITFLLTSLSTFSGLNLSMYILYGVPFVEHTYLHHLIRIDHRHNFSPYNTLLYLSSSAQTATSTFPFESLAFIPQLLLSAILVPLALAKKDLAGTMLAQTFAFVTFNKVCTSQYFLWYLIFLPLYLPRSSFIRHPRRGLAALGMWVASQALWLQQGYQLEFLGRSTFVPGLWAACLVFFGVNCWILGVMVQDIGGVEAGNAGTGSKDEALRADRDVQETEGDGEIEEIPREKTVQELVNDEMQRRRRKRINEQDVLKGYMADIQDLMPDEDSE